MRSFILSSLSPLVDNQEEKKNKDDMCKLNDAILLRMLFSSIDNSIVFPNKSIEQWDFDVRI